MPSTTHSLSGFAGQPQRAAGPETSPQDRSTPAYYTVSILKPPVWKWEIATYFYLGGMSAGAFILSRLAHCFGKDPSFRELSRYAAYVACAAAIPCPFLLIHDLGDPARFHHMLRVWKPSSPMNLGTWVLTSITPIAFLNLGREIVGHLQPQLLRKPTLNVAAASIGVISDLAGVPLALLLAGYTGVLLSNTSNPLWRQNAHLSPIFMIGALSTGASAISIVMHLTEPSHTSTPATRAMKKLDTVLHAGEVIGFAAYLHGLGPLKKPYFQRPAAKHTAITFGGILAAEIIKHLPLSKPLRRPAKIAATALGLAAAFSLRWNIVHAAHRSANDPDAARFNSKPRNPADQVWNFGPPSTSTQEITSKRPDPNAISDLVATHGQNPRHL
jgi:formate-dependent nitrite reductase membrane component NrfD